jgi:hypothetical protein
MLNSNLRFETEFLASMLLQASVEYLLEVRDIILPTSSCRWQHQNVCSVSHRGTFDFGHNV